jgi:Putative peptidoglycan binding domain
MSAREDIDAVNQYIHGLTSVPITVQPMIDSWKSWYDDLPIIVTDGYWTEAKTRRDSINNAIKAGQAASTAAPATSAFAPAKAKPGDGFKLNTKDATIALQKVLGIEQDGAFGPITDAKVRAWQGSHNLKVDGIVGPKTWASLGYNSPMPQIKMTGAASAASAAPSTSAPSTSTPSASAPSVPGKKAGQNKPGTKPAVSQAGVVPTGFFGWIKSLPWYVKVLGVGAAAFGGYKSYEIHKQNKRPRY